MEETLQALLLRQAEIHGDVTHIKERLDNGMSSTLKNIDAKIVDLIPQVQTNSWWVNILRHAIVSIGVLAVSGGLVGLFLSSVHFRGWFNG